ncbi:unnamed protein product [Amoebophrya sp. A120]|nr:unnamed protein product [Amoebophrya sp. A120]|eukprot:GSA120T00012917001.1
MPVITPAFPAMNTTFNVTQTTRAALVAEFRRARQCTQLVFEGSKQWSDVYAPAPFFAKPKPALPHAAPADQGGSAEILPRVTSENEKGPLFADDYVRIMIVARTEERFAQWEGFVESKLRRLFSMAEHTFANKVVLRPWPQMFPLGDDHRAAALRRNYYRCGVQMFIRVVSTVGTRRVLSDINRPVLLAEVFRDFCEWLQIQWQDHAYWEWLENDPNSPELPEQDVIIMPCAWAGLPENLKQTEYDDTHEESLPQTRMDTEWREKMRAEADKQATLVSKHESAAASRDAPRSSTRKRNASRGGATRKKSDEKRIRGSRHQFHR